MRPASHSLTALAALAVLAAMAASAGAATRAGDALPPRLVGHWTRDVTAADQRWSITIKRGGGVDVFPPGGTSPVATIPFSLAGRRLTIGPVPVCPDTRGVYSWKLAGGLLTLKTVADKQCPHRVAVFSGRWRRT